MARKSQGTFRRKLMSHTKECEATGFGHVFALDAAHIKPHCDSTEQEQKDPHNAILLMSNIHRAFDAGMISFNPDDGSIMISKKLSEDDRMRLGLNGREVIRLGGRRPEYLRYHNQNVFIGD